MQRVVAGAAGIGAVLTLAACGGDGPAAGSAGTPSAAERTTTSAPAVERDKLVGPAPKDRVVQELTGFVSPTGNISCMLDSELARCDIIDHDWSAPPKPADCELDYGHGMSVAPGEQAQFVCAGDTAFGPDDVLPYGDSITAGVLRCESAESAITCRDVKTGHGFSLSLEVYRLF